MSIITDHQFTAPGRATLLGSIAVLLLTLAATRASAADYYIQAPVVSIDPIVRQLEVEKPIQHCTERAVHPHRYTSEYRHERRERRVVPSLVGGLVGGLIGNQFGGGSGKKILTVVGALAGSSIANDIAHNQRQKRRYAQPVRRDCYTTYERDLVEQIDGYHVVYEYAGQQFSKQMNEHPGSTVPVRVQLQPAGQI
jgi:uncharacterized protein YcfJ